MIQFGSGLLFTNPNAGNLAVNPTARQMLTLQESSIEISQDLKELRGQNKFPDDIAPGDMKITGKLSFGNYEIETFNDLMFADTRATGIKQIQARESGAIPGSSTYVVTVSHSANFITDLGVTYAATGVPMTRVAASPTVGQYTVSAGVYTFAAADASAAVLISYVWTDTADGRTVQINNQLMGYGPVFELWLAKPYQAVGGKNNGVHLYACRLSKLSSPLKRDAYEIIEMDFSAFANAAGQVGEFFQTAA